jgi:hypothetical protein
MASAHAVREMLGLPPCLQIQHTIVTPEERSQRVADFRQFWDRARLGVLGLLLIGVCLIVLGIPMLWATIIGLLPIVIGIIALICDAILFGILCDRKSTIEGQKCYTWIDEPNPDVREEMDKISDFIKRLV